MRSGHQFAHFSLTLIKRQFYRFYTDCHKQKILQSVTLSYANQAFGNTSLFVF